MWHVCCIGARRRTRYGQLVPLCCPLLDAELLQTTITALVRQCGFDVPGSRIADVRAAEHAPTLLLLEVDQLIDEAQGELAGFLDAARFRAVFDCHV